jgi:hypothetical protein
MTLSLSTLFISGLAWAGDPAKEAAAPMGPPPPAKELEAAMKDMIGNWKCTGKANATMMGPEHPFAGKMTVKADLAKYWYVMRWEETKTKASKNPYSSMAAVGWAGDKLMRADFDSMGGVTHATSMGWKENALTWEGHVQMGPNKMGYKEMMTKDAKSVTSKVDMETTPGKWETVVEFTCKK